MQTTLIVAPNYLAAVAGCAAIQISARKIKLMDAMLCPIAECSRRSTDDVTADFLSLVQFVHSRAPEQAAKQP
jgi:hypothetical protein